MAKKIEGFAPAAGGEEKPKQKRKTRKKAPTITPRQAKYIANRLEGKSKKRSAIEAGYPEYMAHCAATKVETPAVREAMTAALERRGLTTDFLAMRIAEGVDAKKTVYATFEGEISDMKDFIDFEQRGRYIDRALELRGDIKRNGGEMNVNMPVMLVHSIPRPGSGGSSN